MKPKEEPCCPACGRSVATALRWVRAATAFHEPASDFEPRAGLVTSGIDPGVDIECAGCGGTVRISPDAPLAAA